VDYNSVTGNNKIKLLTEYESLIQKALFGNALLSAFLSELQFLIPQAVLDFVSGFKNYRPQQLIITLCVYT
jgi:hypothetical protein